jgi:hypothetical protein
MAESKFDKIFQNAASATAEPAPGEPEQRPDRRVVELAQLGGSGKKTVAAALQAAESVQPIGARPMGRPPGKRSDPAWKQFSILLRRETQRQAVNILRERHEGLDFSGLVENLVKDWIKKQKL